MGRSGTNPLLPIVASISYLVSAATYCFPARRNLYLADRVSRVPRQPSSCAFCASAHTSGAQKRGYTYIGTRIRVLPVSSRYLAIFSLRYTVFRYYTNTQTCSKPTQSFVLFFLRGTKTDKIMLVTKTVQCFSCQVTEIYLFTTQPSLDLGNTCSI